MSPAAQQTPRQDANPIHDYYERIFEILPWAAFVLDEPGSIIDFNIVGAELIVEKPSAVNRLLAGEALGCVHAGECGGCGNAPACKKCGLRNSLNETSRTGRARISVVPMEFFRDDTIVETRFLIATTPITIQPPLSILMTMQDLDEVNRLYPSVETRRS